ncbi:MAG: hypothetical protein LUD77_08825 [Clostridiales bacterium]|nr:hypothetical protein [Clostridiales bacterium]
MGYTRDQIDSLESFEESVKDGSVSLEEFADKMSRLSGRENIIVSLKNTLEGLSSILKPIKEGFGEIFPAMEAERLYSFTEKLSELTAKFKMSDKTAENLKSTFKGLFAILDIAKQGITALVKAFSAAAGYVLPFGGNILEVTAGIGEFIVKIDKAIKEMGIFNGIAETAADIFGSLTKLIGNITKGFIDFFKALKNGNSGDFSGFAEGFINIGTKISEMLVILKGKIVEAVKNLDFNDIFNILSTGMLFVFLKKLKDFIDKLTGSLGDMNIFGSVKNVLSDVGDVLKS